MLKKIIAFENIHLQVTVTIFCISNFALLSYKIEDCKLMLQNYFNLIILIIRSARSQHERY